MRNIVFRGYNDKYGWVYGALPYRRNNNNPAKIQNEEFHGGIFVESDSIGESTEFNSNDGTTIFEGDILKTSSDKKYVVFYDLGAFKVRNLYQSDDVELLNELTRENLVDIIGNTHDGEI